MSICVIANLAGCASDAPQRAASSAPFQTRSIGELRRMSPAQKHDYIADLIYTGATGGMPRSSSALRWSDWAVQNSLAALSTMTWSDRFSTLAGFLPKPVPTTPDGRVWDNDFYHFLVRRAPDPHAAQARARLETDLAAHNRRRPFDWGYVARDMVVFTHAQLKEVARDPGMRDHIWDGYPQNPGFEAACDYLAIEMEKENAALRAAKEWDVYRIRDDRVIADFCLSAGRSRSDVFLANRALTDTAAARQRAIDETRNAQRRAFEKWYAGARVEAQKAAEFCEKRGVSTMPNVNLDQFRRWKMDTSMLGADFESGSPVLWEMAARAVEVNSVEHGLVITPATAPLMFIEVANRSCGASFAYKF